MAGSHIDTRRNGAVGVITINRPERFNALDIATAQDFRRAGLLFARDPQVRAVVVRGLPGMFCSGADLKFIRDGGNADDLAYLTTAPGAPREPGAPSAPGAVFKQILEYIHSTISEIRRAPKPFIAAVDGIAAAGGFGIAMSCDLVFASKQATFEWAYGRTGLTGAESVTFLLPRLIGLRRAMELVLLNPRLSADHAQAYGLVTGVLDVEEFDAQTLEIATRLAAGPTRALAVAKELLNQSAGMDRLDAHLDRELDELTRVADGPEFAEGLRAFFEKRPAAFPEAGGWRLGAGEKPELTTNTAPHTTAPLPRAPSL
jgi:2-(1,2-epoxy-1,2-dihydrophenyl)acetyl-CoA isomerase